MNKKLLDLLNRWIDSPPGDDLESNGVTTMFLPIEMVEFVTWAAEVIKSAGWSVDIIIQNPSTGDLHHILRGVIGCYTAEELDEARRRGEEIASKLKVE